MLLANYYAVFVVKYNILIGCTNSLYIRYVNIDTRQKNFSRPKTVMSLPFNKNRYILGIPMTVGE